MPMYDFCTVPVYLNSASVFIAQGHAWTEAHIDFSPIHLAMNEVEEVYILRLGIQLFFTMFDPCISD